MNDLKVLIQREKIAERVGQLGADITRDFAGQSVIFVGVLKGAAIFLADFRGRSNWTRRLILLASPVTEIVRARPMN